MSCPEPRQRKTTLPPTDRQLQVLRLIERHRTNRGCAPTARELLSQLGLSPNSLQAVQEFYQGLEARGLLERERGKARTARATAEGLRWLGITTPSTAPEGGSP
ncbi:hypothetical protein JY651_28855 [Pyxidicoccus parkwayensis]|uniref:LexA repressor DNA-binding domain-containing protein n=1 Tax=Pyxidicoccus parkwayensis TaxID=2813578 RepID=A0ABX7NPA4_9BACT|nr:hypothetical protein [Pyxidicoccus parkwaysis]QSQ19342.1 hypothetical protein JY651_28855 [Pyxidicoccus parkwaysis]